jgi:hypothetical protein
MNGSTVRPFQQSAAQLPTVASRKWVLVDFAYKGQSLGDNKCVALQKLKDIEVLCAGLLANNFYL